MHSLSTTSREKLSQLLTPRLTEFIPHTLEKIARNPKQWAFLLCDHIREVFYGGAGGGGKSEALLMGAAQYVDVPGYAALILRRTYKDLSLPGALMDRADSWWRGTSARWNREERTWHFPIGLGAPPATITFGYLETENDKYRYQSAEFQYISFDELTQFSQSQYRYLFSRLRRLQGSDIPLRMRSASNPGGIGHDWVKQRMIVEQKAGRRIFIPAKLADNPYLDEIEYRESLAELDPVTRAQIEEGDWTARLEGGRFKREWFEIVDDVPRDFTVVVRFWDLASKADRLGKGPDYTVGALVGSKAGRYFILDIRRARGNPGEVEELIKQTAQLDGKHVIIYVEQEPGASGVTVIDHYVTNVLRGFAAYGHRSTGSKVVRSVPFSSTAYARNVKLLRGLWISDFLDELEGFPTTAFDDQVDAVSGAIEVISQAIKVFGVHYGVY